MSGLPLFDNDVRVHIGEHMKPVLAGLFSGKADVPVEVVSAKKEGIGAFLFAETHKNNLPIMLRCCEEELKIMIATGRAPSPFYFERAVILARRERDYALEIQVCEVLIKAYEVYNEAYAKLGRIPPASTAYVSGEMKKRLAAARKNLGPECGKIGQNIL